MAKISKMRKLKKNKQRFFIALVLIVISTIMFIFSLYFITSPMMNEKEKPEEDVSHAQFIEELVPHAQKLHQEHGVLPSIIIGQAVLESDWGTSELAAKYHNLFGIKAAEGQEKVTLETKEYVNEKWITIQGNFRVYASWEESMDDHTNLFLNGVSWNPAKYTGVIQAQDYKQAAQALQDAGYATDPEYAGKIIQVIEENHLDQYDK